MQQLITNAFSNMGQPVFELIKLQTKAAQENDKDEISFRSPDAGGSSSAAV
jgi:hypothetical protein